MSNICYIISAGDFSGINFIKRENDYVIAADGGYDYACKSGIEVDMVLGDFDSLGRMPDHTNVKVYKPEKDDTDTLLAIKEGMELGYNKFILFGALGGKRIDHSIANMQALLYLTQNGCEGTILDETTAISAVSNGTIRLPSNKHGYFSVFCFSSKAVGVTIQNAKYCVKDVELKNSFPIGVSNEFVGSEPIISVKEGDLMVVWQRS